MSWPHMCDPRLGAPCPSSTCMPIDVWGCGGPLHIMLSRRPSPRQEFLSKTPGRQSPGVLISQDSGAIWR